MDINLIYDFIDLSETRSFSASASNRLVSQPTLSRRIKQLEDWVGAPLVDRQVRPLRLTGRGVSFLPIALEMRDWIERARDGFGNRGATQQIAASPEQDGAASPTGYPPSTGAPTTASKGEKLGEEIGHEARKVLIVDDSTVSLTVLAKLVGDGGHLPINCASGEEALKRIASDHIGLVIADYKMPSMDGASFTKRVREIEITGERKRLPIVAVSVKTDLATISHCFDSGMDDYLCKPVGRVGIQVVLDRWLPRSQTLEAVERSSLEAIAERGLVEHPAIAALCSGSRRRVEAIATEIDTGVVDRLVGELASIRDEAYMAGAYSFGRTCACLAQSIADGKHGEALERRGPFLTEFVRLERALRGRQVRP